MPRGKQKKAEAKVEGEEVKEAVDIGVSGYTEDDIKDELYRMSGFQFNSRFDNYSEFES